MRTKKGVVVSSKMDKTIVVAVDRYVEHRLYKKLYKKTSKFYAEDANNECQEGDTVTIVECAPLSKLKRWKLVKEEA